MGNEITKCNQNRVKSQARVQKPRQVGGKPSSKPTISKKPQAPKPSKPKLSKKLPPKPKPKPPPYPPPTESQSTSPSPEEISSTYEILD